MSHTNDIHSAQTAVLRELLFKPQLRFTDLQQATGLDSKHALFHIKRLIELGYVQKNDKLYHLTPDGKEHANKLDTDANTIERQPKVSVVLIVERQHNGQTQYLAQQRLKHPYYGFWGRLGGKVRWGESLYEAASRELLEETGLTATFEFKQVYHKRDYRNSDDSLLEDKLFFIMHTNDFSGDLIPEFEGGKNAWMAQDEFVKQDKVFESAIEFVTIMDSGQPFVERDHRYNDDEY